MLAMRVAGRGRAKTSQRTRVGADGDGGVAWILQRVDEDTASALVMECEAAVGGCEEVPVGGTPGQRGHLEAPPRPLRTEHPKRNQRSLPGPYRIRWVVPVLQPLQPFCILVLVTLSHEGGASTWPPVHGQVREGAPARAHASRSHSRVYVCWG